MPNEEERFNNTIRFIHERLREFQKLERILSKAAQKANRPAVITKVLVTILGALVASRAAIDLWLGASNPLNIALFTGIGLFIAVFTALAGTFKWENKAITLRILANKCRSVARKIDHEVKMTYGGTDTERLEAALKLLDQLDNKLEEIQESALEQEINISLELQNFAEERAMSKY